MKFSAFERSVLKEINGSFPVPHDASDRSVITIGERPLQTIELLAARFPKHSIEKCREVCEKLTTFQCIAEIYLSHSTDFSEVALGPGTSVRLPVAKPPSGTTGFQVTVRGQSVLENHWFAKIKRIVASGVGEGFRCLIVTVVLPLLALLLYWLFGWRLPSLPPL